MLDFPKGLTVRELKNLIKDWPELDGWGEPAEVWIETGFCASSIVTEICPLNRRGNRSDVLLVSAAFEKEE